jgi:hypothetical protein
VELKLELKLELSCRSDTERPDMDFDRIWDDPSPPAKKRLAMQSKLCALYE